MAAEDTLEASAAGYNEVLVTLLGDVAATYVQIRTLETRMEFVRQNIAEQRKIATIVRQLHELGDPRPERRFRTAAAISRRPDREHSGTDRGFDPATAIRTAAGLQPALCVAGHPSPRLGARTRAGRIPTAPTEVMVGIPADLLRRRPDVRRAERQVAAQAEQIGIAKAELYPSIAIAGTLGYSAPELSDLFSNRAFQGSVGPSFQWNILNYGRIRNNVRLQDARFHELLTTYQNAVLLANAEVENGLAQFLRRKNEPQPSTEAWPTCRRRWKESSGPGNCGRGRQSDCRDHANQSPAARLAGPVARRSRPGLDPSVQGVGRRLGSPGDPQRGVACRAVSAGLFSY